MATTWKSTYLEEVNKYGVQNPMGAGPYGATIWIVTAAVITDWTSTGLEDPPGTTPWSTTP